MLKIKLKKLWNLNEFLRAAIVLSFYFKLQFRGTDDTEIYIIGVYLNLRFQVRSRSVWFN